MDFRTLLYHVEHRIATLTLNRPEKRNALDDPSIRELTTAFAAAGKDPAVKLVVLRARGPAFCDGVDADALKRMQNADLEEHLAYSQRLALLYRSIYELRKPVLAVVEGPARSEGAGLVAACDIVLADADRATFGFHEVQVGRIPALPMLFLLKRMGESRTREMVVRGHTLTAEAALDAGLVNIVAGSRDLETELATLTAELLHGNSGNAMALCKEMLSRVLGMNLVEALDFAANMNAAARMTGECRQGLAAALKNERVEW